MIVFIYGTTAEAIKLAPVIRRLRERGNVVQQWVTMQHTDSLEKVMAQFGLGEPDEVIARGANGHALRQKKDVLTWGAAMAGWLRRNRKRLKASLPENTIVVVHGDTMTSVAGAYIAKRLGLPSAHIEAGLRSGNLRHPFPEELDRRIVGRMASVHYAPSEQAAQNLSKRDNVVFTYGNTANDAVLDYGDQASVPGDPFGIAVLHRFEFIANPQLVDDTLAVLQESPIPVRLIVDTFNREAMEKSLRKVGGDRIQAIPKLSHDAFVELLKQASFVVTDSGGLQEESALLGLPTLVHRKATERGEGIGRNVLLSEWDLGRLRSFLHDYESLRHEAGTPEFSPSDTIVADLVTRGYAD